MSEQTNTLKVKIRTLTPLWTGGVDGTMDRVHETGIIGSLRWWYEAIVRGLGGSACDPTSHACELTGDRLKRYNAARKAGKNWWEALDEAGICDACKVFGTTGWKRRFRLEVNLIEGEFDITEGMFPSGRIHPDKRNPYRAGGWLLHGGYQGTLQLEFIGPKDILWCEILPVLLFIEQWGALGPKTSLGYGVFEILSINGFQRPTDGSWRKFLEDKYVIQSCSSPVVRWWWGKQTLQQKLEYQGILPALTNMFFSKVRFSPQQSDQEEWWKQFDEINWLEKEEIPEDKATWTGRKQQKPKGPYKISNPLPIARIKHWLDRYQTFSIAPILRNRLRYASQSICDGNGESEWCNFVFGTVRGKSPVCGYCGTPVLRDGKGPNRWWCSAGKVLLDNSMVIQDAKRIQNKIRVSWAYQTGDRNWEIRIWGWLPENHYQNQHNNRRQNLLRKLKNVLGINGDNSGQWHLAQNGQLWQDIKLSNLEVCWFEKNSNESAEAYLKALLQCNCEGGEHEADS